jgi:putative copper resistance protein D
MADVVAIGLRALAYAAALLAAGVPIFVGLFGGSLDRSAPPIRRFAVTVAFAGLLATIVHALVEPVRLVGDFSGVFDPSLLALLLGSSFGPTISIRVLGLLLIVGGFVSPSRTGSGLAQIGAALVATSFAFMGHTATNAERWLLAPLLVVHLVTIAFWFGSLWPLLLVLRLEAPAAAGAIIERFSRAAILAVPAIFVAGLAMAVVLLPGISSLGTPYGLSLLAKIAGFSILLALAAMNKWRLVPRISRGDASAPAALTLSIAAEALLIFSVVVITAVMTALFSPEH